MMNTLTRQLSKSLLLGACVLSGTALAAPMGFYVGGSLGSSDQHVSRSNFVNAGKDKSATGSVDSTSFGARLFAGYRFSQYLAVEAGYTHYGDAQGNQLAFQSTSTTPFSGKFSAYSGDVSGKFFLPLAEQVNPYVDLGVAYISSKMSISNSSSSSYSKTNSAASLRFGAGMDFNVNKRYEFGIGWDRVMKRNSIQNAGLLALNFGFYFQ